MTPIETAVAPMKKDAMERAEKEARAVIARVRDALDAHGWNIRSAAPYPDSFRMSSRDYHIAKGKRNLYSMLTTTAEQYAYGAKADIVKLCPVKVERYIQLERDAAAGAYDLFVMKLNRKVGAHVAASIRGNHVWGHSILTVTTPTGVQRWKTQQIVNVSKLGLLFNQWPSRKIK